MSSAKVTVEAITDLVSRAGLKFEDAHTRDYSILMSQFEDVVAQLGDDKELFPRPDLSKYPRTDIYIPEDTNKGGWATKVGYSIPNCCWSARAITAWLIRKSGHRQSDISHRRPLEGQENCHQRQRRYSRYPVHKWYQDGGLDARL